MFEYGLEDGMLLKLVEPDLGPMRIKVNMLSRKTFDLDVEGKFTVAEVKRLIEDTDGLPPFQQVLISPAKCKMIFIICK